MIKKILRSLRFFPIAIVGISLVTGCAPKLKPFDNSSLGRITFSFTDIDNDEGEIGGDLTLDLPTALIPAELSEYVIYWGSDIPKPPSYNDVGKKGELLGTVPVADFKANAPVLYTIPEDTAISDKYFLLYLKGKDEAATEVYSGKASLVPDKYEGVQVPEVTDVTQEAPPEEKPEEVSETATPTEATPTDTPTVTTTTPDQPETTTTTEGPVVVQQQPITEDNIYVVPIENVLFEFDKSYLRSEFKEQLNTALAGLESKDQVRLLIAGHADERGSNEYNLALGERRAFAVKRYLISMGFLAENIRIISYGEEKPIDSAHNEDAWMKNRRAETEVQ